MLLIGTELQAATNNGHVWLNLQSNNVRMDEAVNHFSEWISLPAESTFELLSDETDQLGMRHMRYRQYVAGVEVQASMLIVHGRNGMVTTANGVVMEQAEQPKNVLLATRGSSEDCYLVKGADGYHYARLDYDIFEDADIYVDITTGNIVKSLPRKKYSSMTMQGRSMYSGTVPITVSQLSDGKRVMIDETRNIYTLNGLEAKNVNKVDYELGKNEKGEIVFDRERYIKENCSPFYTEADFYLMPQLTQLTIDKVETSDDPFAEIYIVVKNNEGEIVHRTSRVFASSLPLKLDFNTLGGTLAFINNSNFSVEIYLYQYIGDDTMIECVEFSPQPVGQHAWSREKTTGSLSVVAAANPVVDIHWGMQKTYDWYKSTLGRDSYDGKGGPIYNFFLVPTQSTVNNNIFIGLNGSQNNAIGNIDTMHNCFVMEYGIGDGLVMRPVVALDIMAHEFTHLVTASTAQLEYKNESGALNESFSDMMGICVKRSVQISEAKKNWLIGDDVMLQVPCMRDMSHKVVGSEGVQPIYYKGKNWCEGEYDNGGVHINSGVPNYWFYLLCEGLIEYQTKGTGTAEVWPVDIDEAAQIAYRALTQYLTPTSNFQDARMGTLMATADIYGFPPIEDYDPRHDFCPEYDSVLTAWQLVGVIDDDSPTGITPVASPKNSVVSDNWYNLQGQRIDKPSLPGVYIHKGKKVLIK